MHAIARAAMCMQPFAFPGRLRCLPRIALLGGPCGGALGRAAWGAQKTQLPSYAWAAKPTIVPGASIGCPAAVLPGHPVYAGLSRLSNA